MDGTIWLDPHPTEGKNLKDLVGLYGCELKVCEDLLTLGYAFSNHVRLDERKDWLEKKISQLEEQIRLTMRKGGYTHAR